MTGNEAPRASRRSTTTYQIYDYLLGGHFL